MDGFANRLIQLIEKEKLSATSFAERIGIQRSTLSHLFSGRNKPGFEFLIKITDEFPLLNLNWLITGNGEMYLSSSDEEELKGSHDSNQEKENVKSNSKFLETSPMDLFTIETSDYNNMSNKNTNTSNENKVTPDKKIDKMIFVFSDGTFEEYKPSRNSLKKE